MTDKGSSSQIPEFSTQHNQSANVPSEPPTTFDAFSTEQNNLRPIFRDPLVEEANAPSQYIYLSEEAIGSDLYGLSYHEDFFIPYFESSIYPPLSPLNSFSDTSAIILSPPPQPQLEPPLLEPPQPPADHQQVQENPEIPILQLHENLELLTDVPLPVREDQVGNNDAVLTKPILPSTLVSDSTMVMSPGSSTDRHHTMVESNTRTLLADDQHASVGNSWSSTPTMVDDTCTGAIATNPCTNPQPTMLDDTIPIANEKRSIESSIEKQTRRRKIQRVISTNDVVESLQQIEQANDLGPNFIPEEAIAAEMDVIKVFLGQGPKKNILKPLIVRVDCNEDVAEKIKIYAEEKGPVISIIGAAGTLSVIQLLHQGRTKTFEGKFKILSLYGTSLSPKEGDQNRIIQLSIAVADGNGHVFGGPVQGQLVASTLIQLVGVIISPRGFKLRRLKTKPKHPKHQLQTTSTDRDCATSNTRKGDGSKIDEALAEYMNVKLRLRPQSSGDDVSMDDVMQDQVQ